MKTVYFPSHNKNRMKKEGDVVEARNNFFVSKNKILFALIEQRFSWMNDYISDEDEVIIEIGSGPGLSKQFIHNKKLLLTDVLDNEWIDMNVDALNLPFEDNSIDVIICSHMIHHVAHPIVFLESVCEKLKPGGRLIIQDIYTGSLLKCVLWIMRHEGWSDRVDVFDKNEICNDPVDPWSANCSIPKLLFWGELEKYLSSFEIIRKRKNECFLFLLSGGVIAKTFSLPIGERGVQVVKKIDNFVVNALPDFFACGCSIVLKKQNCEGE